MIEPHGDCPTCKQPAGVRLGTRDVLHYKVPTHRFNKILYVEKTGFMNQLLDADVHRRFDVAIAAGAGFSVQAARELFAKVERQVPVTIYCLHDADIQGCDILRTLGKKLVHEDYKIRAVDLGLRPAEAIELGLPTESAKITAQPSLELRRTLSQEEMEWLLGEHARPARMYQGKRKVLYVGNRVELNAFTPREFVSWVEDKLQKLGDKVVPDDEVIVEEAKRQRAQIVKERVVEALLAGFDLEEFARSLPASNQKANCRWLEEKAAR